MPTRPPGTPDLDLTFDGASGTINGGVFQTPEFQSAGSGVFNPFVRLQHTGSEQGYNSDAAPQYDEKVSFNHSILLANVPIVIGDGTGGTMEGTAYREFRLDLNEMTAGAFLSLDALQIWQEEAGNLTNFTPGSGFTGAHTNYLVYNLDAGGDHWVGLNDALSHGSGQSDIRILIPDSDFINDAAHRYVTLYSQLGLQSGWNTDGGFEEWGINNNHTGPTLAMAVHKSASVPGGTANVSGEVISYSITVDNVGDTALTGITVTDPSVSNLAPVVSGGFNVGDTNHDNKLSAGETWQYTASHTVTQTDLDTNGGGDGFIDNTVTADSNETAPVTASSSVTVEQSAHITLAKSGTVAGGSIDHAGEPVTYSILITNDGSVTLNNPAVTDPSLGTFSPLLDPDAPILNHNVQLFTPIMDGDYNLGDTNNNGIEEITDHNGARDPGETFQYVYVGDFNMDGMHDPGETWVAFNLGDTNNNGVKDVGETFIGDANNNGVEDSGEHWQFKNVWDTNNNGLQDNGEVWHYANSGDDNVNGVEDSGETFRYANVGDTNQNGAEDGGETFQYYNAGDTNHNGVEDDGETFQYTFTSNVAPVLVGGFNAGDTNLNGSLDVGETWQYTGTYTATQNDIDHRVGGVPTVVPGLTHDNTASVTTNEAASDDGSASVPIFQNPDIVVTKTADVASVDAAGDVINYTVTVDNAGNMTLTGVTVSDSPTLTLASGDTNNDGELDLDETWTYTGSYTVTQDDIDNGGVVNPTLAKNNTATADTAQTSPETASASVHIVQDPSLTITKTADVSSVDAAGDVINYTVVVDNDGNMTLTGVTVTDSLTTLTLVSGDADNDGKLDVNETWTYTGSYTVQQSDIDNGGVVNPTLAKNNTATADTAQTDPETASTSVHIVQNPDLTITKTADVSSVDAAGDIINYTVVVDNAGNMTLTGVSVTDSLTTLTLASGDTNSDGKLDVNETWTYTGSYTVQQSDIDNGGALNSTLSKDNTATADTAQTDPETASASVHVVQSPSLTITKTSDVSSVSAPGDVIHYTVVVDNTGNMTLTGVAVTDSLTTLTLASGDTNSDGKLDLNETWTYTGSYTTQASDFDGSIDNTATVDTAQTNPQSASTSVTAPAPAGPALTIDDNGSLSQLVDPGGDGPSVGDLIQFFFQITNHTSTTLTNVAVSDTLGDAVPGSLQTPVPTTLAGNDSVGNTFNHHITAADLAAHHVIDDITVTALDQASVALSSTWHYDFLV